MTGLSHTSAATNERIKQALIVLDELVAWALADAEHAQAGDARGIARDDRARASKLLRASAIVAECIR